MTTRFPRWAVPGGPVSCSVVCHAAPRRSGAPRAVSWHTGDSKRQAGTGGRNVRGRKYYRFEVAELANYIDLKEVRRVTAPFTPPDHLPTRGAEILTGQATGLPAWEGAETD